MKLSRKCINYSGSTWNFALFSENITPPGKKFYNRRSRRPRQISTLLLLKGTFWAQDICLCSRWSLIGEVAIESSSAAFMNFSSFLCFNPPMHCLCFAEVAICMELKGSGITFWARDVCDHPLTFHSLTSHPEWLHFKDLQTGKYQLLLWFVSIHSFESFGKMT